MRVDADTDGEFLNNVLEGHVSFLEPGGRGEQVEKIELLFQWTKTFVGMKNYDMVSIDKLQRIYV